MTISSILVSVGFKLGSNINASPIRPHVLNSIHILAFFAFILCGVGTSYAQSYSGQATAARVTTTVVGQPVITTAAADTGELPSTGGTISLTSAAVNVPPPLTVGSSNVSAIGSGNSTHSIASINNVNIGVLTNTITATVVSATANAGCPGQTFSGSSTFTGLTLNSGGVVVTGDPNQEIQILLAGNPVGVLRINEQIVTPRSITVNALHLIVTDPGTLTVTDVVIGSARAGINCGISPISNLYSGRGTGVSVNQVDVLTGDVTTFISDTGPLPTSGGTINASTTGAGIIPPLLTTGVVTASTQGGTPVSQSNSAASVDNLGINLLSGAVTIGATVLNSTSQCTCSLGVPTCNGTSQITNLSVNVLGLPVSVTVLGTPNQIVNIPVLGLGSITLTLNGRESGTAADVTAYPLRIQTNLLGLVSSNIVIARSHSDIVCALAPSAAAVSVSGRVFDPYKRPIRGAMVSITDMSGVSRRAITNTFGYFTISGMPAGESYLLTADARRYTFDPRLLNLQDSVTGLLIVGTTP